MSKKHGRLKSLRVERTQNGITVHHEHEPAPQKKGAKDGMAYQSDYDSRHKEYSFNDHDAAQAHVQKHMAELFSANDHDGDEPNDDGGSGEADGEPATPADVQPRGRFVRR